MHRHALSAQYIELYCSRYVSFTTSMKLEFGKTGLAFLTIQWPVALTHCHSAINWWSYARRADTE